MSDSNRGESPAQAVSERRKPLRKRSQIRGLVVLHDGTGTVDCRIEDASEAGAKISFDRIRTIPERVYLMIAGKEIAHEAVVAWVRPYEVGLNFVKTLQLESVKNTELQFLRRLKLERLRN